MEKQADSSAVPFADSAVTQASMSAIPTPAVGSKPAPGQTGPKGMAPRTNYSRVNSGASPTADLGASAQKSVTPDAQSFLPPKVSHIEVPMNVTARMTIHDMIKAAGAGVQEHAAVALEAERQTPVSTKLASKQASADSLPTDYIMKFAEAVEYVVEDLSKEATDNGPGAGPNHLAVTESMGGKNPFQPGNQGQATPKNQPPKNPGLHAPAETPKGPANALDDNASMMHGKQKLAGTNVSVDDLRKAASVASAVDDKEASAEKCKGCGKEKDACTCSKTAGVDSRLVDGLLAATKLAEDAINPAHISAGAAVPPDTSASGEAGGAPAGGKPQGATGLIASNEAATNYTKGQAKAQPKSEMAKVITEPALSAAHDKTLSMAFTHTGQAGVKISSAVRTEAARAYIAKLAEESETESDKDKKKKKESAGGGFTAPPVGGVAGSGGM